MHPIVHADHEIVHVRFRPGYGENPLGQICRVGSLASASVSHFSHGIVTWPRRQVTKIRLEPSLLLEIRTLISPRQWKQNMWKIIFCTLWLSAKLVVTFWAKVLLGSLEYSTSCNTQVTVDWTQLNLGPSVYGLNNHGRPAWSVCTSWGMVLQKSLFLSFLPICRKKLFPRQQRFRRGTMMHWWKIIGRKYNIVTTSSLGRQWWYFIPANQGRDCWVSFFMGRMVG